MSEYPIVRKNDELVPQEDGSVEPVYGKVLKVASGMEGFDINGMLARLMQYANMADALSHVERTLEYVVQIPLKHREAFNAGEVFLNQNTKTGVMWPTLYETLENGKRKFVDNLPIKQEEIIRGNPFESMAVSYHKRYTPEEFVILEQEHSGERWHGVPLSELSKLAQTVYHGKYVKVDQWGFLRFITHQTRTRVGSMFSAT